MILAHPQMDTVLRLAEPKACSLVVENPVFYRSLVSDFYGQLRGDAGSWVLSEKGETMPISKWVELVDNCLCLELNRKTLLNKIWAAMENAAISEAHFPETSELLCRLETYLEDLAYELPGDIVSEKCTVSALIRGMGVRLRDDYEDPLERLLDFMELVREFDRDKLFVLVGLRGFFGDKHVNAFLKTALSHGYRVLMLDCVSREKIPYENRITIDNDLCEF